MNYEDTAENGGYNGAENRSRTIPLPPEGSLSFPADLHELLGKAWAVRQETFPPVLTEVWPKATKAVSLTGTECALDCAHCGGHYLRAMTPLDEVPEGPAPVEIERAARAERPSVPPSDFPCEDGPGRTGAWAEVKSCLVSGGCDKAGKVPVLANKGRLAQLRRQYRLNMHVGLVSSEEARQIGELADAVSFDLVGDDETIHEVYNLDRTAADYFAAFDALRANVAHVVPHICIGLLGGRIAGERRTLAFLAERQVESVAFIVFSPTQGTRLAEAKPPALVDVIRILAEARIALPHAELHLGCMRPKGSYRAWLDLLAVRAGVNRIVQPTVWARELAESLGLTLVSADECCVF